MADIILPTDQTEGTTNTVGKWFKQVGDRVSVNDPLLEITTDKVTVEIAATADGILAEILKHEGETVEPGEVLGRIGSATARWRHSPTAAPRSTWPPRAIVVVRANSEAVGRASRGAVTTNGGTMRTAVPQTSTASAQTMFAASSRRDSA